MFVKKRALAEQFVGKQVASELVTMHDGACAAKEVATYFFDDEGVLAKDTVVIDKGILKAGISDAQSAMHLGTVPTGNGRRESYQRKAYTRMTNTFFTNMSISTPWPKASCTIMPVASGVQMQSYSPGVMGSHSRSSRVTFAASRTPSRIRSRSSAPPRLEKPL